MLRGLNCRLYRRDPHQLFELLCLQLRSIATLYSNMFKNMLQQYATPTPSTSPAAAPTATTPTASTPSASEPATANSATTTTTTSTTKPPPPAASAASPSMFHCDPVELINCEYRYRLSGLRCECVEHRFQPIFSRSGRLRQDVRSGQHSVAIAFRAAARTHAAVRPQLDPVEQTRLPALGVLERQRGDAELHHKGMAAMCTISVPNRIR